MRHQFQIRRYNDTHQTSSPTSVYLSDNALLALYSVFKATNNRVVTIKTMREVITPGLYEAKQVVDFIAEHANMGEGESVVNITQPRVYITYVKDFS